MTVTPFSLLSSDSLHFRTKVKEGPGKNKLNSFVDVLGERVPELKGHMKKCMFKVIVEGN